MLQNQIDEVAEGYGLNDKSKDFNSILEQSTFDKGKPEEKPVKKFIN